MAKSDGQPHKPNNPAAAAVNAVTTLGGRRWSRCGRGGRRNAWVVDMEREDVRVAEMEREREDAGGCTAGSTNRLWRRRR
uniref:Uncharacterized protein n=1 Tax=Kalanchoe fedtschenkoi TaxID=63787 RepID=A0A7N0VD06_KALFE